MRIKKLHNNYSVSILRKRLLAISLAVTFLFCFLFARFFYVQVVWSGDEVDLERLPLLHSWECDGGAFVTLPMVNTIDPETGMRNVGMYRMQRFDKRTTGMHWHIHKTGARHYDAYKRLGRKMPVVVALGGDPAYTYAATAPIIPLVYLAIFSIAISVLTERSTPLLHRALLLTSPANRYIRHKPLCPSNNQR